ncbi:hypothetical protein CsSME_00007722 [Camellia sinensis var. sinensis]
MRGGPLVPAISISASSSSSSSSSSSIVGCINTLRRQHCSPPLGFHTSKYWDKFYKRHQNKFFKDRHYLVKDWGQYFYGDNTVSPYGKVILEVGCGAGNTIFPLIATCPKLFVHACDFSSHAIALVKSHVDFNVDQVNAFVCDVANDDLCDKMMPSSIDVVTLIFMLSAVCPKKMPLILKNIKKVLKPNGYILLRDYAIGDYAQVELRKRNQMISENFYVRGDGTCAFYFSEEYLSTLFMSAGFSIVDMDTYSRQIQNRSRNITMFRRWTRATFRPV